MTPNSQQAAFERDYGCTLVEWLRWLPGAVQDHPLQLQDSAAWVALDGGGLQLCWQVQPPRRIALISMPRLLVRFDFGSTAAAQRSSFLRYFDLYMQRGGG